MFGKSLQLVFRLPNVKNLQRNSWHQIQIICKALMVTDGTMHSQLDFNEDSLLSAERKIKCMHAFQSLPRFTMSLPGNKHAERYAAVLIALWVDPKTKEVSLLYTKRSSKLKRHSGQVAFPGGVKDPEDKDFIDCALREGDEEIGLKREKVEIWGEGSMFTPPLTNAIMPVVGVVRNVDVSELILNPHEVDEAFTVPIKKFFEPGVMGYTQLPFSKRVSPSFVIDGKYKIWGVTGYLTYTFLHCFVPKSLGQLDYSTVLKGHPQANL